jgi:hypothetical protein
MSIKTGNIMIFFLAASFLLSSGAAMAHQPVIVGNGGTIKIEDPEMSKAYYGELSGAPAIYTINSSKPFELYLNLLVPEIEGEKTDKSAEIMKDGKVSEGIDGLNYFWFDWYEPFGDDYYRKGPEIDTRAEAGIYYIKVYSPDNLGKYVLAVGKIEKFSIGETLQTLKTLPTLKKDYFGKPAWTAYNNYIGLVFFIVFVLITMAVYSFVRICKIRQKKKEMDKEYKKNGCRIGNI